jgi:type VI secretion system secreted protein Hcp
VKRNVWNGTLRAGVVVAGLLASSGVVAAATDMFLKIGNIKGESLDKVHHDEIDVLAWSWGTSTGTGRTKKGLLPSACIQDLSITKYIDKATPDLIVNGVSGAVVPTARLTVRKDGVQPLEFLRLDMTNVTVVSYQTGGSGGEDRLTENVTLHFEALSGVYRQQNPDGTAGPEIPFFAGGGCPQ